MVVVSGILPYFLTPRRWLKRAHVGLSLPQFTLPILKIDPPGIVPYLVKVHCSRPIAGAIDAGRAGSSGCRSNDDITESPFSKRVAPRPDRMLNVHLALKALFARH